MVKILTALLLAALPATASMIVGPEHSLAGPAFSTAITEPQAAATDGTRFLVLSAFGAPLRLTVVSPDGSVSAPARVVSRGYARGAAVVWTGDAYLATWGEETGIVVAARFSADGAIVSSPSKILNGFAPERGALAWNGSNALLLYITTSGKLSLALLSADGRVVKDSIPVASGSFDAAGALAASGNSFVYCWTATTYIPISLSTPPPLTKPDSNVFAVRISGDGAVGTNRLLIAHAAASVSRLGIASDGRRCAITFVASVFNSTSNTITVTLYRSVIAPDDTIEQLPPFTVTSASPPTVVWNGRDFVSHWITLAQTPPTIATPFDLYAVAFSASATPAVVLHGPRYGIDPIAISNGPATLVLWSDFRFTEPGGLQFSATFAAVLDRDGHTLVAGKPDGISVSLSATPESGAKLAAIGSGALAVWTEGAMPSGNTISAVRLDARGVPIGQPVAVANGVTGEWAVLAIRSLYVVLWSASDAAGSIVGRRMSDDGAFLDATPIAYATRLSSGAFTAVSAGDSALLMVALGPGKTATVAIDAFGLPAATPVVLPGVAGYGVYGAWNGTEYLLTWTQGSDWWQFPAPDLFDVYGLRVARDGTPLDGAPIAIATGPADQLLPSVASDGRDFLVVYVTKDFSNQNTRVSAKRILSEGVLADTTANTDGTIIPIPEPFSPVSLVRAGTGYALSWESAAAVDEWTAGLAYLDARANILDRLDRVASSTDYLLQPAIALTQFEAVMAYTRMATEPEYADVHRVFVREIAPALAGRHRAIAR